MIELQDGRVAPERARDVLDGILARAEFAEREDYLLELVQDFFGWIGDLFGGVDAEVDPATLEAGLRVLWIVVAVLAGVVLVAYTASLLRSRAGARGKQTDGTSDEVAQRVAKLRCAAREAQTAGDMTRALRLYFFALVIGLGERGELAYDDAWTNRELLERGDPSPAVSQLLGPLVGELDAHSFGRRPTDPEEVRRFASLCERLLGGGAA